MRIQIIFLSATIFVFGLFQSSLVQAKEAFKIDHKHLSGNKRGGGDSSAGGGKVEKPFSFKNKCAYKVLLKIIYKNKSGRHSIATLLSPGQSGSSSNDNHKAHTVLGGSCKKMPSGGKCTPYIDSKARKWKVKACK